jgi:hypothetical protein
MAAGSLPIGSEGLDVVILRSSRMGSLAPFFEVAARHSNHARIWANQQKKPAQLAGVIHISRDMEET